LEEALDLSLDRLLMMMMNNDRMFIRVSKVPNRYGDKNETHFVRVCMCACTHCFNKC